MLLQKHYKIGFQPVFSHRFWAFWVQKSRVNNWATVGSITGPHVGPFFEAHVAQLLTQDFCLNTVFFEASFLQKSHSPCRKKKKENQRTVAQLLTQQRAKCGPVIDPTAHIYICCGVIVWAKFGLFNSY